MNTYTIEYYPQGNDAELDVGWYWRENPSGMEPNMGDEGPFATIKECAANLADWHEAGRQMHLDTAAAEDYFKKYGVLKLVK